jgi:hypothetical protein
MATNQHATTEEWLEAVFSVIRAMAIAMQWLGKHISVATNPDTTMEVCVFYWSVLRSYKWDELKT